MSNKRDHPSEDFEAKGVSRVEFEAKGVSRGEFAALKRFGDYEQLSDGTLMRMEGNKEFRIYCEDSGWLGGLPRGMILTSGVLTRLSEAHDRMVEKVKKDPGYLKRLQEDFRKWQVESQRPASTTTLPTSTASSSVLPDLSPTQKLANAHEEEKCAPIAKLEYLKHPERDF